MGFPENIMTSDEQPVLHLRPHWKRMVLPFLVLVVTLAAAVAAVVWLENIALYVVLGLAAVAYVIFAFWPWVVWRSTHYIFTNERIIFQTGVFSRERRDIPLMRVNDHSMNQSFFERMLGCGTLVIESAGERGQTVLHDIPGVNNVQTKLYELVESDRDKHSFGDDEVRTVVVRQNDAAAENAGESKK